MIFKPCIVCGEPSPSPRCAEHALPSRPKAQSREQLGYDDTWRALSRRARRLQPWCSDCGTVEDLTADHSPEAWRRREAGLVIRLTDVDVVCRSCNSRRGRARPWGREGPEAAPHPPGKAQFEFEIGSHLDGSS